MRALEARGIRTWALGEVAADDGGTDADTVRGAKGVEGGAVRLVGEHRRG